MHNQYYNKEVMNLKQLTCDLEISLTEYKDWGGCNLPSAI